MLSSWFRLLHLNFGAGVYRWNRLGKTDVLGPGPGVEFTVHGVDLPSSSAVILVDGDEAVNALDEETAWDNSGGPSESDVGAGDAVNAEDVHGDRWLSTLTGLEGSLAGEGVTVSRVSTEDVDAVGGIGEVVAQVSLGNGSGVVGDQGDELGDEVTAGNVGQADRSGSSASSGF